MATDPAVPFDPAMLEAGDCLLYGASGFFGWIISEKTWHGIAHCESYIGGGRSVASRDGLGVNIYPLRTAQLVRVLRPAYPFNQAMALEWFTAKAQGQPYNWRGLLRFAWHAHVIGGVGEFCSEFLTRWYRAGRLDPFNHDEAGEIAPFEFDISTVFREVWTATPAVTLPR